jgi:ribosomal protein S1
VIESLAQAEEKVSLSIHTLSEEPWAAARTHTNATPDLVLNTMAG